jgi:hypothetical protein
MGNEKKKVGVHAPHCTRAHGFLVDHSVSDGSHLWPTPHNPPLISLAPDTRPRPTARLTPPQPPLPGDPNTTSPRGFPRATMAGTRGPWWGPPASRSNVIPSFFLSLATLNDQFVLNVSFLSSNQIVSTSVFSTTLNVLCTLFVKSPSTESYQN